MIPRWIKITVLSVAIALGGGLSYYYFGSSKQSSCVPHSDLISDFDEARDFADVKALFVRDWQWLSVREYSEERLDFMIKGHSPNEYEPRYFGKMTIRVLREKDGAFVGFITYYMKNAYDGHILFLAVDPAFRGKRYAEKLLDYARADLKCMGAQFVTLVTYPNNASGIRLYTRYGF